MSRKALSAEDVARAFLEHKPALETGRFQVRERWAITLPERFDLGGREVVSFARRTFGTEATAIDEFLAAVRSIRDARAT
jgi:hypothetical protein